MTSKESGASNRGASSSRTSRSTSGNPSSEHAIQTAILLEFGALPWLTIWRMNTGKAYGYSTVKGALSQMQSGRFDQGLQLLRHAQLVTFGTPGAADIQGILDAGRFLAIEVKRPDEIQTDEQLAWEAMVNRRGGLYILAHSVEEVRYHLRANGYPA